MNVIGRAPRGALLALVALALAGPVAACGSSSSASTTTTATASAAGGGPNSARRAALVACLKQHGVTLPARPAGAPGGGPGGGPRGANPKLRAAFQACGAKLGFRAGQGFRARLSRGAITKYVTCVRQHGYNLPAPNFSGRGPVFPSSIRTDPKFQAASRACQNLLAPPRASRSGTGAST